MNVKIRETGEIKSLSIQRNGIGYERDFIGNAGAFSREFAYDDTNEIYVCGEADYEWWTNVLAAHERIDEISQAMRGAFDDPNVLDAFSNAVGNADLDAYTPASALGLANDLLSAHGKRLTVYSDGSIGVEAKTNHYRCTNESFDRYGDVFEAESLDDAVELFESSALVWAREKFQTIKYDDDFDDSVTEESIFESIMSEIENSIEQVYTYDEYLAAFEAEQAKISASEVTTPRKAGRLDRFGISAEEATELADDESILRIWNGKLMVFESQLGEPAQWRMLHDRPHGKLGCLRHPGERTGEYFSLD